MTLPDLYRSARSLEAIENYAHADDALVQQVEPQDETRSYNSFITSDFEFWRRLLKPSGVDDSVRTWWGEGFSFFKFVISEWVARVPGLFWSEGSDKLRELANLAVQYESEEWTILHPPGKSEKVIGGVGTLKLPPNGSGNRLVTVSAGHNASSGVPVLVSPEVWEHHKLREGCVVSIDAAWQEMSVEWSSRFPSIRGIPRGYLVLEKPSQISEVVVRDAPTQIHPFTIMEYARGNSLLFDFVYATADTADRSYRKELEEFFEFYKNDDGRYGRYLLSADIGDPLWESDYDEPAALRRDQGAIAQLDLLEARVRKESFRGHSLDLILDGLATNYDDESLKRLSDIAGLPSSQWYAPGLPIAALSARMLETARKRERIEVIIDAIALDYPNLFAS
jgi:hypothetical protein